MSNQTTSNEYQKEVSTLILNLEDFNDNNGFQTMELDLLGFAFPEFLASERFAELPGTRRKELFSQYEQLKLALIYLHDFFDEKLRLERTSN